MILAVNLTMKAVLETPLGHRHHILITIAAGLPAILLYQDHRQKETKIIRVMPNTPAPVSRRLGAEQERERQRQGAAPGGGDLPRRGRVVILDEGAPADAVTGLSSSGPAYVFSFVEALVDAGVKMG